MKIDTYKALTYDEDERIANPDAYWNDRNSNNRKIQHVFINRRKIVERVLGEIGLEGLVNDCLCFSILWNFPRRERKETRMWVTVSGFTHSLKPPFVPNNFQIATNVVSEGDQKKALDLIDLLNSISGIEVEYQK